MTPKQTSRVLFEVRQLSPAYMGLFLLSIFNPVMYMATPIFAQQVFDRISLSRNETTLWVLAGITAFIILVFTVLDTLRNRTLARIGIDLDQRLTRAVFDALNRQKAPAQSSVTAVPLHDLNLVRDFLSGPYIGALFDAFWSPIFIVVAFIVHPWLGVLALALMTLSAVLGVVSYHLAERESRPYQEAAAASAEFGSAIWRNSGSVRALGMLGRLRDRWYEMHRAMLGWQSQTIARTGPVLSVIKFLRNIQPVMIYTVGGWLYLLDQMSLGGVIVASIILSRGLAPIDFVIGNWRTTSNFLAAKHRLDTLLDRDRRHLDKVPLPRPTGALVVSRLVTTAGETDKIILNDISFAVAPGRVLGVLGASGAGKSSLAQALVGLWPIKRGNIALGDHDIAHWDENDLGRDIGYVPQDIELLPATLADNIARFDPAASEKSEALLAAVANAGIADLVKSLPQGLNTMVGAGGHILSGGQRQRIALARALYDDPHLVVMDEPNSNLDTIGEASLALAIQRLRERGSIVVVVTHKMSLVSICDDILMLSSGVVQAFGPRTQVLERLPKGRGTPSLTVVESTSDRRA